MNTDKLAINWQNFARVRLLFKFAFVIRSFTLFSPKMEPSDEFLGQCEPIFPIVGFSKL